jgi:hypothetical protein
MSGNHATQLGVCPGVTQGQHLGRQPATLTRCTRPRCARPHVELLLQMQRHPSVLLSQTTGAAGSCCRVFPSGCACLGPRCVRCLATHTHCSCRPT